MSALLNSLPGDIPGLLRRGSPVVLDFWSANCHDVEATGDPDLDGRPEDFQCRGVITGVEDGVFSAAWLSSESEDGGADDIHQDWMTLDLTDPTGRWHAAIWAKWESGNQGGPFWSADEQSAFVRAIHDELMFAEQIDTLARLVLRLAGRTP